MPAKGTVAHTSPELRLHRPELVLLHLGPDPRRLKGKFTAGGKSSAMDYQIGTLQGQDAAHLGMAGVGSYNQARFHSGQVKKGQLPAPAQAKAALFTVEVGLPLPAHVLAVRPEKVRCNKEAPALFFNRCPRHQVKPVFHGQPAVQLKVFFVPIL